MKCGADVSGGIQDGFTSRRHITRTKENENTSDTKSVSGKKLMKILTVRLEMTGNLMGTVSWITDALGGKERWTD